MLWVNLHTYAGLQYKHTNPLISNNTKTHTSYTTLYVCHAFSLQFRRELSSNHSLHLLVLLCLPGKSEVIHLALLPYQQGSQVVVELYGQVWEWLHVSHTTHPTRTQTTTHTASHGMAHHTTPHPPYRPHHSTPTSHIPPSHQHTHNTCTHAALTHTYTSQPTHLRPHPHHSPPTSGPRPHCTTDLGSLAQVANQFHKRVIASSQLLQHLFPWRSPASSFHGESFICVLHIPRAHIH